METTTIFIIIFFVFISSVIIYSLFGQSKSSNVIPIPSNNTIQCGILDPNSIKKCDADTKICESCQCLGNDPSVKMDCMTCQVVDDFNPYSVDIEKDKCTGSNLLWDENDQKCHLEKGSYCLPAHVPDIKCNQFTGRKMLSQTITPSGELQYEWKCICKNDTMFSSDGGDCDHIKLCGMDESSQNPNSDGRGLFLVEHPEQKWSPDSNIDPFPSSGKCYCKCIHGEVASGSSCLLGNCKPCDDNTPTSCNCGDNTKFIDCSEISMRNDGPAGTYYTGICKIPSAVPNPCIGAIGSYYDQNSGKCVCDPNGGPNSTWRSVPDASNTFGMVCKDLCANNGLCGDRGTCYIYPTNDQNVWTILCSTNPCSSPTQYIYLGGTNGLGNNLKLTGGGSDGFLFEPTCYSDDGTNCSSVAKDIHIVYPGDEYYIKTDGGLYIDFKNQTTKIEKSDDIIIKLISDSDTPPGSFKINLVVDNSYITGNGTGNMVSANKSFGGTARCKDCKNGYHQDSQGLCQKVCGDIHNFCTSDSGCCSGHCSWEPGTFGNWCTQN